jgi:serine/threonine protein kinase/formylglycine-generating enzyme required for sulfatase activity
MPEPRDDDLPAGLNDALWQALALPSAARTAAIDALCGLHPDRAEHLRARAASLIAADAERAPPLTLGARPRPPLLDSLARAARGLPAIHTADRDAGERDSGKYLVGEVIGKGGMGVVRAGRDNDLDRDVALKFLQPALATDDDANRRFLAEARLGGQLQHPGIVPIYDIGVDGEQPFFAMKLVNGTTFASLLAARTSPQSDLQRSLAIFLQICQAIAYAHKREVIHRDLKPGNVMVGEFGEVVVLDWGLAKKLGSPERSVASPIPGDADDRALSRPGTAMGTCAYMSPEQARGQLDQVDRRTDVFALGSILCEVLTAAPAYDSAASDPRRRQDEEYALAAAADLTGARARLAACDADPALIELALACLAPQRDARPADAAAIAERLGRHLAAVEQRAQEARIAAETERVRARAARQRQRLFASLAAVVLVGLLLAAWLWRAAETARRTAEVARAEFDQLAGVVLYDRAVATEQELYPPWPEKIDAMERWLREDCGKLLAMRPQIEETVANLRARLPQTEARPTWTFAEDAAGFLRDRLNELLDKLGRLEREQQAAVEQRLRWARGIEDLSIARHRARWEQARTEIKAIEKYRAVPIDLRPQTGLVPIGANPVTGLWEFYELRSAWDGTGEPASILIPTHDAHGRIEVAENTGIVFVLLPGGTFTMGAQSKDPNGPNYDPRADEDHERLFEVTLAPFLLARHELTQGQWLRLTASEPSYYKAGKPRGNERITLAHPVESVSWEDCERWLTRFGLALPTEAQWEYGCRAGTTAPWSCSLDELGRHANLADDTAKRAGVPWTCEAWTDGRALHAPVGTFAANGFGLCDVHGNVWEWTHDGDFPNLAPRAGDGLRGSRARSSSRVCRGGSYSLPAAAARASHRYTEAVSTAANIIGVRPARPILH